MTTGWLGAFVHLVAGVLLVGLCLFWVVMAVILVREAGRSEAKRLLGMINRGRWPPAGVPPPLRLPFPVLGWIFLIALAATGMWLLGPRLASPEVLFAGRFGRLLAAKLTLFGLLLAGHAAATFRPRRWLVFVNGGLVLLIVCVSALLRH